VSTSIVVDLGFGDAGKGAMVDALARRCSTPPLVVRYNGGAQAGHNVHTADGRHHTFSQFGSGTFVPGSRTLLSEYMILHPPALMAEHEHLVSLGVKDALQRLVIDARALVVTPYQQAMNRLRELARGEHRHGTCGLGVGETVGDSLELPTETVVRAADLMNRAQLRRKLSLIRGWKQDQLMPLMPTLVKSGAAIDDAEVVFDVNAIDRIADTYAEIGRQLRIIDAGDVNFQIRESEHVIFEGAQGVLLDEWHGFHPHTTWSTTTTKNAGTLIERAGRSGKVNAIGVVRAYATRHGQGPFPTEDAALTQQLREPHNSDACWQGQFRVGWFDVPLTRYALSVCPYPVTELAVTCLDRLMDASRWSVCDGYEVPSEDEGMFHMFGGFAMSLRVGPRRDLAYQERLAQALGRCVPRRPMWCGPRDPAEYMTMMMRKHLDLPVSAMSFGPTADDKRWA